MSFIDIMIILLVVLGIIIGWMKGFVSQISSICGIVLGLVACNLFGGWATDVLKLLIPESCNWPAADVTVSATAHIVLFVVVFLSVLLAGTLIKSIVNSLHLGVIDKVGGAAFCSFKYLLYLSILLNLWYDASHVTLNILATSEFITFFKGCSPLMNRSEMISITHTIYYSTLR